MQSNTDILKNVQHIITLLSERNMQIGIMESCTSGLLASTLTDVAGASKVLSKSYVTYSNQAKIDAGVQADIIDNYGVYSPQTAADMALATLFHMNCKGIAIGVTGTLGNYDPANSDSQLGKVYYAIANQQDETFNQNPQMIFGHIQVPIDCIKDRKSQKEFVCSTILKDILTILQGGM